MLLDTGSTPVTRKAAAIQIGEIQKIHPHELHNLLKKVNTFHIHLAQCASLRLHDMPLHARICVIIMGLLFDVGEQLPE